MAIDVTLVDSNVILDLVTDDVDWAGWSSKRLEEAALRGPLLINEVIYAELSVRYERIEALDAMLEEADFDVVSIGRPSLFLAGKAFKRYRERGGSRPGVLPDFFIGAHAAVMSWPLLTRDTGRYATYFPTLTLISPASVS